MPTLGGAGGARAALHTDLFLSLQSSEGVFTSILNSLAQGNFYRASPQTPKFV